MQLLTQLEMYVSETNGWVFDLIPYKKEFIIYISGSEKSYFKFQYHKISGSIEKIYKKKY